MKKLLLLIPLLFWGCEKEYSNGTNYRYMFQAKIRTDEWGIPTWGGHLFTTDEKIKNIESFKQCYVAYLKRSGKDVDGLYNKLYWQDSKNIEVTYDGTTYARWTDININGCGE